MLSENEVDLINELRTVVYSNDSSILELKSIFKNKNTKEKISDDDLTALKEFFSNDKPKINADNNEYNKEIIEDNKVYDIVKEHKETNNANFDFIGTFDKHPSNAKELNFYKNYIDGIVFIYKNSKWVELIKDGQVHQALYGGGLGERDVVTLIKQYSGGGGGSFTGSISGDNVYIDTSLFSVLTSASSATAQQLFLKIDREIAGKIIFGDYATIDVIEEPNGDLYVGSENQEGKWYFKRVQEVGPEMFLRYANVSNNINISSYTEARNNYLTLAYDMLEDITV